MNIFQYFKLRQYLESYGIKYDEINTSNNGLIINSNEYIKAYDLSYSNKITGTLILGKKDNRFIAILDKNRLVFGLVDNSMVNDMSMLNK